MRKNFDTIADFIEFKTKCVFCDSPLVPKLTNFLLTDNRIPLVNARLSGSQFKFDMKYTSVSHHIDTKGALDINTNELRFEMFDQDAVGSASYQLLLQIFEQFKPHIDLSCYSKSCKMSYGISSNVFTFKEACAKWNGSYYNFNDFTRVKPFLLYYESCNVDKYWVQSDWIYNKTKIISINNPNGKPIEIPFLSFDNFNKEQLKTRIKTYITFG